MKKIVFEVKEEHLKLLRKMEVGWNDCEFGAPAIDCKRPFGNSGVFQDIVEILCDMQEVRNGLFKVDVFGKEYFLIGEDKYNVEFEPELEDVLMGLYRETEDVLRIALNIGYFRVGKYEEDDNGNWKCIGE